MTKRILDLDFGQIRENFKNFLKEQDEFSDYDLTQSGLDVIINLLSYGIHYDAFQANFSNNEMYLDSAQLRKNVVSRAKHLMYTPKSMTAARIMGTIYVEEKDYILPTTLFIPKGSVFLSREDNIDIGFVTTESYSATKSGTSFTFPNVSIYEGSYVSQQETGSTLEIKNKNIDINTLEVYVKENTVVNSYDKYERVDNILKVKSDSRVYYLEENADGNYKIFFGDGVLGKKVSAPILATYVVTNGARGNGISNLSFSKTTDETDNLNLGVVRFVPLENSSGGTDRESIESIRFNAPRYFSTQKVILNDTDANFIIPKKYADIKSVNIWSGKNTGTFGKTFISLNPYLDNLTDERINEILTELERERFVVLTSFVHVLPTYIDLGVKFNVYYDNFVNTSQLETTLYNRIIDYSENNIEDFKKNFISSKFINQMTIANEYDFDLDIRYRLTIFPNSLELYSFDFKNEITSISTTDFTWRGVTAYMKNDGANLNIYSSLNNGFLSNIGTVDLKTGAVNISAVNIQMATDNEIVFIAIPKRESIFATNNNILRILEKDISITYENKN